MIATALWSESRSFNIREQVKDPEWGKQREKADSLFVISCR